MKFIVFVLVVLALWMGLKQFDLGGSKKSAAPSHSDGYLEARARFTHGSTELDMVVVEEKPLLSDCKDQARAKGFVDSCPRGVKCEMLRFECKSQIDARYQKMLDRQPTHLHYAHIELRDAGPQRSAAVVVWGMSVPDSERFCGHLVANSPWDAKYQASVSCVASR